MSKEPKFSRDMERVTTSFEITRPLKDIRRELLGILHAEIQAVNYQKYVDGKFDLVRNVERVIEHSPETPGWGYPWNPSYTGYNWNLETNKGKLIKRIRAEMPKELRKSDVWGKLGGMLNDSTSVTLTIDTTTRLDWHSGEFGDEGSCFWSEHAPAREAMHDHSDCGAVRSWKYSNYRERWEGIGRCWYYYDKYKDTIFLFNGYGNTKSQFASALQELFDYPERRHYPYFHALEDEGEHLWNNSGGILLYKPGANIPDGDHYELSHLSIEDDEGYYCQACDCRIAEDEVYTAGYYNYCQDCFYDRYVSCCRCGEAEAIDDAITDAEGETYCDACGRRYLTQCEQCEEWVWEKDSVDIEREGDTVSFCSEECRDAWERENPDPEDSSEQ